MEVITNHRFKQTWKWFRRFFRAVLVLSILAMAVIIGLLSYIKIQGPPPLHVPQTSVIYGNDNTIIGESHQGQNRYWVSLDEIAPEVIEATIAIEDRKFYEHHGFDFVRIGAAALANIQSGSFAQGASTITQQYARNLYLGHDKTWQRKINEALYALKLEVNYTKKEILEGYLNTIYYGHGAYGIEAAAHHYFNKSASELSLAEASLLAGIPKGPTYYSPLQHFDRAKGRQETILNAMVTTNFIGQEEAEQAKRQTFDFSEEHESQTAQTGAYFQDAVRQQLINELDIDPELIESGGLHIYTTLDADMQSKAEQWVKREIGDESELQTALVAIDPRNGDVRALVGGRDYQESPFNRATQAKRMPGSTFKPFLYYAALEQGFTPASTLKSEPTTFNYDDGRKEYSPGNFADNYADDFITMAQAIAFSDNIYAVKTNIFLGTEYLVETAERMGITSPLADIPSLALGTMPVGVLEIVNSYSPFANGGIKVEPRFIKKVVDQDGEVLYEQEPIMEQVLKPELAYVMTDLMTGMFDTSLNDYTSVTGQSIAHLINRPVAGKSGSTSTDSWMIGYTPQLVAGVWIGYDQGQSIHHSTEGQHAKKIWANFIEDALADQLKIPFRKPSDVTTVTVNPSNGLLATESCPVQREMSFITGTEPTEYCTEHIEDHNDAEPTDEEEEKEKFLDRIIKWFQ
ncbi:transglycosylase domain-containing protein [Desertibacillus haloalkaliphilus]|uniref:transglycosylase domain-containing protein n=1 Tax=Desertibacillus haloalkaliphilus TaxID=1328930 RepID=UPI001C25AA09|nr:penicillin-binding protein 1A [Desertibacillus haloalkaliphilus]MBU8905837.1 penicillin-binding protein 1A [Desertibacillus haloalkaliphilus]